MALPVTISDAAIPGAHSSLPPVQGPDGAIWVFVKDGTSGDDTLKAMKGSDPTTSFSEQDASNRPNYDPSGVKPNLATLRLVQRRNKVHLVSYGNSGTNGREVWYYRFDLSSETWDTPDGTNQEEQIDTGETDDGPNALGCDLIVEERGNDIVAFYQGPIEKDTGTAYAMIYACRSTDGGATWGTPFAVTTVAGQGVAHYTSPTTVLGVTDNTHIFFKDHSNNDLYERTMNAADTFQTEALIDNNIQTNYLSVSKAIRIPTEAEDRVWIACLYHDSSGRANVAEGWSWTQTEFHLPNLAPGDNNTEPAGGGGDVGGDDSVQSIANNGQTLHVMYSDDTGLDLYRDSNQIREGDWGSSNDVTVDATLSCIHVSCNVVHRAGQQRLAYLYESSSAILYNEVALSESLSNLSDGYFARQNSYHGPFEV